MLTVKMVKMMCFSKICMSAVVGFAHSDVKKVVYSMRIFLGSHTFFILIPTIKYNRT